MSPTAEQEVAQTETKPETTTVGSKTKAKTTGNLILDIATEVEGLSKTKALNLALKLYEDVEVNYFKLGGVLKVIQENSWFEGHPDFATYVRENFGFEERKAKYLISIYTNLVTKQIPWEKVSHLGWTKLKDLAPKLTAENVDEWVKKAENATVLELQAMIKAGETSEEGDKAVKTTDDIIKFSLKLKQDQADIVQQALAKAKGELHTEYDTVALENICASYVGGNIKVQSVDDVINQFGWDKILERISELHPEYDFKVEEATPAAQTEVQPS